MIAPVPSPALGAVTPTSPTSPAVKLPVSVAVEPGGEL